MKSALDSNATAGEDAQAGALATPGGGTSPAEPPRACPDCGASSGNPQGDGWQCGACSACNPVCSGCNKVVRVTVRRLCVPCHKEADRLVLRILNPRDAAATDQRARQDTSAASPAGAPSPAEGDGRSGPQAAGVVPLPPAAPVGEPCCTCDAWFAPPEAQRRHAPDCPASEGDGRSGSQAAELQLDRIGAVRAALALLVPHQPSEAETPAGWSARARQGDPEALIYNAILSLDGALQHLAAPERGKGGA